MCGIAGFTGQSNPSRLRAMTNAIHYRGPDADGFFENGIVNLGSRRLSIIDLATGDQPIYSSDKSIVIVYNGEIYNFRELKEKYLRGHAFTTGSDTEVIIKMYQEKGQDFLSYLNGMFTFALWDDRKKLLLIARDRMGKKPLYYAENGGDLYFASEPKSLIAALGRQSINQQALSLYLAFQFIPGNHSIYQGFEKLLPGHYLVWQNGSVAAKAYWKLEFNGSSTPSTETLGTLLADAVQKRLISDVPLGIFLSGGIDSSTVAYYATRASSQKIKTFSIGFKEKSFDESSYFNLVAQKLDTDHHHKVFSKKELLDVVPKIFELQDEPLADASILPTYLLSEFTRSQVTVALGGDGADELFAGYPTFIAHRLADWYARVPRLLSSPFESAINHLPVSHDNISFDFKLKQFIKGARQRSWWRDLAWIAAFNFDEQQKLLSLDTATDTIAASKHFAENYFSSPELKNEEAILKYWQQGYLIDDILVKVDRAAMYNSLEVRAPFLDHRVVEYVNNLPYTYKLRGFRTKYLLKELMRDKLPAAVVDRPKKGFGIPLAEWLRTDLRELAEDTLSPSSLGQLGYVDPQYVRGLLDEHMAKQRDHRMKLWTLITLVQWHRKWMR